MAIVNNPQTIDLDDIQGMVIRGYGKLLKTAYFHLQITDAAKAREWVKSILPRIDSAAYQGKKVEETLHLAFTATGLTALGLHPENLETFPIPFREGMDTENRNRQLGDFKANAPTGWQWGGRNQWNQLHMLLIFHTRTQGELDQFLVEQKKSITDNGGITLLKETHGYLRPDNKEPFGFHDGISQPVVKGSGRPGPENDMIETGEFLMGYKNEYDEYAYSPIIKQKQGDTSLLKTDMRGSGKPDLGRNGSFMVYRQMQQHVDAFWKYMEEQTKKPDGSVDKEKAIWLASKCIGRWPSGASLVEFPDKDPGGSPANDDFGYADKDPYGYKCPYGSHLRRNNPRDAFRWYGKKQSLKISRRHRIIRRGRTYTTPEGSSEKDAQEIGLHFICFNTDLELQFEFIQHAWANSSQLRHLNNDVDVIIGVPAEEDPNQQQNKFTVQAEPVNEFYTEVERFVTIRGGEYFFLPGISALKYLTTL